MPKICESVCDNINEKYERLLNEVVKPLQDTVNNQAAMIQEQKGTIDNMEFPGICCIGLKIT